MFPQYTAVGGKPASGFVPDVPPALGSTSKYGDLTIVSKPDHHDNFHQTIIQPNSPQPVHKPACDKHRP